jgi:hypothetical protein
VLSLKVDEQGRTDRRIFVAGLTEWIGKRAPAEEDLAGTRVIEPGFAHIRTILATGGEVLGMRDLALDANEPGLFLTAGSGGDVLSGGVYQRKAGPVDDRELPVLVTHGYMVLTIVAEELAKQRRRLAMDG